MGLLQLFPGPRKPVQAQSNGEALYSKVPESLIYEKIQILTDDKSRFILFKLNHK
jgi:hypothetical protein